MAVISIVLLLVSYPVDPIYFKFEHSTEQEYVDESRLSKSFIVTRVLGWSMVGIPRYRVWSRCA